MKTPLKRKTISDTTTDSRIVDASGEDLAYVSRSNIVYSEETARTIIRAVNNRERLEKDLERAERELARHRAVPKDLKPIDLMCLSRNSNILFTHIQFEDFRFRELLTTKDADGKKHAHNWLEFGECAITNEDKTCFLGSRIRDSITDFEHDSCYVVRLDLIGLKYQFTSNHVSYFTAHLTTNPEEIKIYEPEFVPEKVDRAWHCEDCEEKHLMLPDGYFSPPTYKFARVVAGQRVTITMGPRWDVIEKRDAR